MIQPRYYQNDAVNSVFNYFYSGKKGNPLICMPTGTGKSLVIAGFIWSSFVKWPSCRMMMLTHDERLIAQNAKQLKTIWAAAPVGICCAGLKQKQMGMPITYGSLKTVCNIIESANENQMPHFGYVDLIVVDECHLISPNEETQYRKIISALLMINPDLKVIGLTATPYRMKLGHLTNNGIFTDVCYDCTDSESFLRFIEDGYLCNVITKKTNTEIDVSRIKHSASGEFNEKSAEKVIDDEFLLLSAINEMKHGAYDRHCWLIFTPSIKVCEHVSELMTDLGINNTFVHSKLKKKEVENRIEGYKNGEYLAIVNKDMLTVGFDHPPIDFIGNLRASESPGQWVQMVGRGTRPYNPAVNYINGFPHRKRDLLVYDFAANTKRLGPINAPVLPREPGKGGGDAPVWICPECNNYNAAAARFCMICGLEHTFETKFLAEAADDDLIKRKDNSPEVTIEYLKVTHVTYSVHHKEGKPPSLKVTYYCGLMQTINEYLAFESNSKHIKNKCRDWWYQRSANEVPFTTYEVAQQAKSFRIPKQIKVNTAGKYPELIAAEW